MIKDFNYKICLIGMPGSGKSTIGKEIANIIGYNFIDTDKLIEVKIGMKISKIFQSQGEEYFRKIEKNIFDKIILLKKKLIISTGGGIILNNRESLKKTYNIYLNCNISTLIDRLALSKDRPLMGKNSSIDIKNILKKRENFYINVSNLIIDANGLKKSTVINILDKIKNENNK